MARNFRVFPRLGLGQFSSTEPDPEVYLQLCYPYPTEVLLFQPDLFETCPDYLVVNSTRLSYCISASSPWTNYLTERSQHFRCCSQYRLSCLTSSLRGKKVLPIKPDVTFGCYNLIQTRPRTSVLPDPSPALRPGPGLCRPLPVWQRNCPTRCRNNSNWPVPDHMCLIRSKREFNFHIICTTQDLRHGRLIN